MDNSKFLKNKMIENYTVGNLIYDPNIYDVMNRNEADLFFYRRWLPMNKKDSSILELCCGTGRLTIPIAKEGYDISGVDVTPSMLERAKMKATKEELNIEFIEGDIRNVALSKLYDLILIPFNSIHHLYSNEDLFNAFTVVKKHLKTDGHFLFDCFNPNIQYIVEGEQEEKVIAEFISEDGREIYIKQKMHYDKHSQINRIKWHYYIDGAFDSIQNLDMRMYFPQELDAYLKWSGFKILHKFGSFEDDPFDDNSDKQIFVCTL